MEIKYQFFKVERAICFFRTLEGEDRGYCTLHQHPEHTIIRLFLKNLPAGTHGFHVHEFADLTKGFDSLGGHYNPYNKHHGDLNAKVNHLGDLGSIVVGADGTCNEVITVNDLPLMCNESKIQVIGRSMVIHADADDFGKGGFPDSLKSGHSGMRIASGVIGYY